MKRLYCIIFLSLLLSTTAHAYWWRFSNFTTKIIVLKMKLRAYGSPYYALVYPDMSTIFDWSPPHPLAGFCFEKIEWIEAPQDILENRDLVDENHVVIDNQRMNELFTGETPQYTLKDVIINYFPSELYKRTVNYAGTIFGQKMIKWAAQLHVKSKCKSRHVSILEDKDGEVEFFTQKS